MTLLLVRHGESEGNVRGLIQGQRDEPLTDHGRRQAAAVAERLRADGGADRLVASPLARAFATAEAIGEAVGLAVTTDDRLMEYDFGEISGLTVTEARERYPDWTWLSDRSGPMRSPVPGEEGLAAFDARVAEAVAELMAFDGRTIAVVHGGVVASALNVAMRMHGAAEAAGRRVRFPMKNCGISELDQDEAGRLIVRRHNDASHLPPRPSPGA